MPDSGKTATIAVTRDLPFIQSGDIRSSNDIKPIILDWDGIPRTMAANLDDAVLTEGFMMWRHSGTYYPPRSHRTWGICEPDGQRVVRLSCGNDTVANVHSPSAREAGSGLLQLIDSCGKPHRAIGYRRREIPALDGHLKSNVVPLGGSTSIVSLEMLWRNPGLDPVSLDCARTRVAVYEVANDRSVGSLGEIDRETSPLVESNPHKAFDAYVLEPKTDSVMQESVVLPNEAVFIVHWSIVQEAPRGHSVPNEWHREVIVHTLRT